MLNWLSWNRLGTLLLIRRKGEFVGRDQFGNSYYRERGARNWRRERRWVVYATDDEIEPSTVPPGWHAWLHHVIEKPPTELPLKQRFWEKPYVPNRSGTPEAWLPPGHPLRGGKRPPATGDYEPWRPEG